MIVQSQETIPVFHIGHGTLVSIGFRDYRRHELTHGEALFRFLPSILIPFGRKFVLLASLVFCFQSLLSVFELNRMKFALTAVRRSTIPPKFRLLFHPRIDLDGIPSHCHATPCLIPNTRFLS